MKREQKLGERELDILQELWKLGPTSVGRVHEGLQAGGVVIAYTTVQTMLNRLEEKRLVERDASERVHRYRALVGQSELAVAAIRRVALRFFDGSSEALVNGLVENDLSPKELERLRRLIVAHRKRRS